MSDLSAADARPSFLQRPPMWIALCVCVLAIVAMALLRLVLLHYKVVPIAYGVPLVLFVWLRHRALLWFTVAAFTVISVAKFFYVLPTASASMQDRILDFTLVQLDMMLIACVMHLLIDARDRIEQHAADLQTANAQLETINRELAAREEEVARQNEELQSQTEELERQTEETRVTNDELARRERITETLLSLSRSLTTELTRDEMMTRICEVLGQILDSGNMAVGLLEQDGDVLRVRCHYGFGPDGLVQEAVPMDRSFSALVLSRGRTAYVENLGQRPDLVIPQPKGGEPFKAVLSAPLRALGWPVGTLEVYRRTPGPWGDDEVAVIESVAAQTSISLEALQHLEQVSHERRRFEAVVRAAPVGIAVANADCSDVRLNPAGAAILNVAADANYMEQQVSRTAIVYRDGRVIRHGEWPLAISAREGVEIHGAELEVALPNGRRISLLLNAAPVRDASGKSAGAVAAFLDITTLKELQRELDTRRREAEEASVRKTRFLAAVSHDIRTPANAITLLAELIRRTASNPAMASEVPELAKEIHSSALSLVELLGDVLDLARYVSGRLEMQESEFSLGELLDEELRRFTPLAREKGLALNIKAPEPAVRVRVDRIKLSRVVGNLIGNAIKFTSQGEVRIEAGAERDGPQGIIPFISVRDTGIGIEPENQQNIFDEFVQLHNRERDRNKGTGLGLTICKRLVDAMGGTLLLESAPGKGSTFTLKLPPTTVVP
jgi:PAS domain S-box-containing protein